MTWEQENVTVEKVLGSETGNKHQEFSQMFTRISRHQSEEMKQKALQISGAKEFLTELLKIIYKLGPGTVAYACSLRYVGGRDTEDGGLRPAWAKS